MRPRCQHCGATLAEAANRCPNCAGDVTGTTGSRDDKAGRLFGEAQSDVSFDADDLDTNPFRFEVAVDQDLAMVCDRGHRHRYNEDCGMVCQLDDGRRLLIVADGVSTSRYPAMASRIAIQTMSGEMARRCAIADESNVELVDAMRAAIHAAHQEIVQFGSSNAGELGPECTIVAACVERERAIVAWVGDSRAYHLQAGTKGYHAQLVTHDDSWVEWVVRSGQMTRAEAERDLRAHCVTQVLGMTDLPLDVHCTSIDLALDDILLICTDGMWNYIAQPEDIANWLNVVPRIDAMLTLSRAMVLGALSGGGHDNITVAAMRVAPASA